MTKVIIMGHGGYGTAMQRNIHMLVGDVPDFLYIDFNEEEDLDALKAKIAAALETAKGCGVLFACDLAGGSPFREAATLCAEHEDWAVVAGLNTSAYTDMVYSTDLDAQTLAGQAAETAKASILIYSKKQNG